MNDRRYQCEIKYAYRKHHIQCVFAIFCKYLWWILFVMFALLHISSVCISNSIDTHCVCKHNYMIGKLYLLYKVMSIMMLVYNVLILLTDATEYYLCIECHYHISSTLYEVTNYVYYYTITFRQMTHANNYSGTLYTI